MQEKNTQTLFISPFLISGGQVIALVVLNVLIMLSNMLLSLFLCKAIWDLKLMKSSLSFRFIFALALSDLSIGVFLQPTLLKILLMKESINITAADFAGQFFTFSFGHFSNVMILIIAADRYLHMYYLQDYAMKMNRKRCKMLIISDVVVNALLTLLSFVASYKKFFHTLNLILSIADITILTVIFILYVRSFFSIRNRISTLELGNGLSRRNSIIRSDFELSKGMLFILLSIFLCYLPFSILEVIVDSKLHSVTARDLDETLVTLYYWALLLVLCFPSCNAILFTLFNRRIRRYGRSFLPMSKRNQIKDARGNLERKMTWREISL